MRGRLSSLIPPPLLLPPPRRPDPLELPDRSRVVPVVPFPPASPAHGTVPGIGSRSVGELVGTLQWFHMAASCARSWRVSRGRANMYRIGSLLSVTPTRN